MDRVLHLGAIHSEFNWDFSKEENSINRICMITTQENIKWTSNGNGRFPLEKNLCV